MKTETVIYRNWRFWVAPVAVLAVVAAMTIWRDTHGSSAKPRAPIPAHLTSVGIQGNDAWCGLAAFPTPHGYCDVRLQPGSAQALDGAANYDIWVGHAYDAYEAVASLFCGPVSVVGGVAAALECAAIVLANGERVVNALDNASRFSVCAQISVDYTPTLIPYGLNAGTTGSASWHHPIVIDNGLEVVAQWQNDGACHLNLSNSASVWWFYWHCNGAPYGFPADLGDPPSDTCQYPFGNPNQV